MQPHRSQTAGFFFPIPQLFRTGRKNAAIGWITASTVAMLLTFVGIGVALGGSGAGVGIIFLGLIGLGVCGVGEMQHAKQAVREWNEEADEHNYQQFLAWQRAADEQRTTPDA